jgi:hypothetical protein
MGGFLILEYQKSSAAQRAYLASRIGYANLVNQNTAQSPVLGLRFAVLKH